MFAAHSEEFASRGKKYQTSFILSSRPREANFPPKIRRTREETAELTASRGILLSSFLHVCGGLKTNKCLHILRTLRKVQYDQNEIDLVFKTIVLPNLTYGLSVGERDLNTVQNFLNRCYKRRYISVPLNFKDIMHTQDKKLVSKARALSHHPLNEILPKPKPQQYNLRRKVCVNTLTI